MTEERKRPAPMAFDEDDDVEMKILEGQMMASSVVTDRGDNKGYSTARREAAERARRKRRDPPESIFGDDRAPEPTQKRGRVELVSQLQGTASWNKLAHVPKHILTTAVLAFLNTGDQQSRERMSIMTASKQFYEGVRAADRMRMAVSLDFKWNRFFANTAKARDALEALAKSHPVRKSVRTLRFSKCESVFATAQRRDNAWVVGGMCDLFPAVATLVIDNEQRPIPDLKDVFRMMSRLPLRTFNIGHLPMDFFLAVGDRCSTLRHLTLGSTAAHLDGLHEWVGLRSLLSLSMASMRPRKTPHEITDVLQACISLTDLDVGVDFDSGFQLDNNKLVQNMMRSLPKTMASIRIHVDNPSSRASLDATTIRTAVRSEDGKSTRFPDLQTLVFDVITSADDDDVDEEQDVIMSAEPDSESKRRELERLEKKRREHLDQKHREMADAVTELLEGCRMIRHVEVEAPYLLTDAFMLRTRDLAYGLETLSFIPGGVRDMYRPLMLDLTTYCNWRGSHPVLNHLSLPHGKARFTVDGKSDVSGLVQRAASDNMPSLRMHMMNAAPLGLFAPVIERGKAIRHLEFTGSQCVVDRTFLEAFRVGTQIAHFGTTATPFALRTLKLEGEMDFSDTKSWAAFAHSCPQLESVELTPTGPPHASVVLLLRALVENKTADVTLSAKFAKGVGEAPTGADLVFLAQLMDVTSLKRKWNYIIQVRGSACPFTPR